MKEFLKKNFVIILAFALPVSFIAGVALFAYLLPPSDSISNDYPSSGSIPTSFNFIYSDCSQEVNYYAYYCEDYIQEHYSVVDGKLVVNTISQDQFLNSNVEENVYDYWTDDEKKNAYNDWKVGVPENYTVRFYLHDTKKNESREITLEEVQTLPLSATLISPDGVIFSEDDDYLYEYYLTKSGRRSELNLIDSSEIDYYIDYFDSFDLRFIGWVLSTPPSVSDQKQSFETIARQGFSGHDDREDYVIKEISEWRSLWNTVNATVTLKPVLPSVDFNNEMIIAVFQGSHSTGGYSIEIIEILEKANSLEITVRETSPPPGSFVTQAFTQPFHIIKTERSDKEIVFIR